MLPKMLDENEFLRPYGIRSLSKFHEQQRYIFQVQGEEYRVDYLPAESTLICSAATPTSGERFGCLQFVSETGQIPGGIRKPIIFSRLGGGRARWPHRSSKPISHVMLGYEG
jgi:hypothetical protein